MKSERGTTPERESERAREEEGGGELRDGCDYDDLFLRGSSFPLFSE